MRISFNQASSDRVSTLNGYGYAASKCKESLTLLGHEVNWRDPLADIEINFVQPEHWFWTGVDYRIGYTPWESTELPDGWVKAMNEVDEVWTPSPIVAQWYEDAGVKRPIKVYEHGVEPIWTPRRREVKGRFKILHHGAEALRKGGSDVMAAFQNTLWHDEATLMMKMDLKSFNVINSEHVEIYKDKVPLNDLVDLYHKADMFCYPSYGEGFGLTPLQAMATGMPVLITSGWAPYEHLLPESSIIKSELVDSPWPEIHPGKMFRPIRKDLEDKMWWHYAYREKASEEAFVLASKVHEEYNWTRLTRGAFAHLT